MTQLFPYLDTIEKIIDSSWGHEFKDSADAQRAMLASPNFPAFAALALARRWDSFVDALIAGKLNERRKSLAASVNKQYREIVKELEEKHGECPTKVASYIVNALHACIGRSMTSEWFGNPIENGWTPRANLPPPKGTDARREYDRWRRKKPKKESP